MLCESLLFFPAVVFRLLVFVASARLYHSTQATLSSRPLWRCGLCRLSVVRVFGPLLQHRCSPCGSCFRRPSPSPRFSLTSCSAPLPPSPLVWVCYHQPALPSPYRSRLRRPSSASPPGPPPPSPSAPVPLCRVCVRACVRVCAFAFLLVVCTVAPATSSVYYNQGWFLDWTAPYINIRTDFVCTFDPTLCGLPPAALFSILAVRFCSVILCFSL